MDKNKIMSRIVAVVLALIVGVTFSVTMTEDVSAAVKKPAKVTKLKVTEKTTDTLKAQWKKQKKVSGVKVKYKVFYKQDTSGTWKTKVVKKNTYTIPKLEAGTKYNIKVRAYIKKNGKTYRAAYSKTISAKTKGVSKADLEKYTEELTQNGVPEEAVDDVLEIRKDGAVEKVEVTEKREINGTQVIIGEVKYDTSSVHDGFIVIGDSVYDCFEPNILESATLVINHQEVTVKTGKSVKVPNAAGTGYLEIHDVFVEGKKANPVVEGTTDEGGLYHAQTGWYWYDNSGSYKRTDVPEGDSFDYSIRTWTWDLPTNGGNHMYVYSNHPDINIYWTCDGTEPQIGQEDLFGMCRWTRMTTGYLRGILDNPDNPLENAYKKTQLRGTTSYGEKQVVFPENNSMLDENKFWIKAYAGDKLIYEDFSNPNPNGYEVPTQRSEWKEVIWEKYAELIEYEEATYGPETPGEL